MTRVVLIDPRSELILHSIAIESRGDAQRLDYWWHKQERERGYEVDRILVSCGTVRLMARDDPVTVPISSPGKVLDGAGVICKKARG